MSGGDSCGIRKLTVPVGTRAGNRSDIHISHYLTHTISPHASRAICVLRDTQIHEIVAEYIFIPNTAFYKAHFKKSVLFRLRNDPKTSCLIKRLHSCKAILQNKSLFKFQTIFICEKLVFLKHF